MTRLPESIRGLFLDAGWVPSSPNSPAEDIDSPASAYSVFAEFGGLEVGKCGPGLEGPTSNVRFFAGLQEHKHIVAAPWEAKLGSLVAVADAHNDHIIVFMSSEGKYYLFTDPDENIYFGGNSFGEAMERLLLGKKYGAPIEH